MLAIFAHCCASFILASGKKRSHNFHSLGLEKERTVLCAQIRWLFSISICKATRKMAEFIEQMWRIKNKPQKERPQSIVDSFWSFFIGTQKGWIIYLIYCFILLNELYSGVTIQIFDQMEQTMEKNWNRNKMIHVFLCWLLHLVFFIEMLI